MKSLKYSQIEIEGISASAGKDKFYLKISYRLKEDGKDTGRTLSLEDEHLMYALFDAQLINAWDILHVYYVKECHSVGCEGEWITEHWPVHLVKYDYLREIDDYQALIIVRNHLITQ